jgi:hypothetical protein
MATLRNLAISILRLAGDASIAAALPSMPEDLADPCKTIMKFQRLCRALAGNRPDFSPGAGVTAGI